MHTKAMVATVVLILAMVAVKMLEPAKVKPLKTQKLAVEKCYGYTHKHRRFEVDCNRV